MNELAALEAVLFVTEHPVPAVELAEVLELPKSRVEELLAELGEQLSTRQAGVVLKSAAGGWRLYSHPDTYPYLERFSKSATARKVSAAAMETLAVIAYHQPVSRSQVSEIRGVDSDSAVRTLERLGFIEEKERLNVPGNPAVYETTGLFLEKMGLNALDDLPPLADHVPPAQIVDTLEESLRPGGQAPD
ncbi:MAG TPA: SMC-Scp complex subunit ScpB [Acidimicrobiia bacterium]|nr:SMC-Scp complex subunit ScpB [Acidimicrobiia bacterium]